MAIDKELNLCELVSNGINDLTFNSENFCGHMSKEHRAIQQDFTDLCITWLKVCAGKNYPFDSRNAYSHYFAKALDIESVEDRIICSGNNWSLLKKGGNRFNADDYDPIV